MYAHQKIEKKWQAYWQENKSFQTPDRAQQKFYVLDMFPYASSNGLHLGYACDAYIQDAVIRYKKLAGFDVLWIPGIDYARTTTQAKVEAMLKTSPNQTKAACESEKFVANVWAGKEKYAAKIRKEWGQLGLAFDYHSERFTMDKGSSNTVSEVFIKLYNEGLIHKSKQAVNYDVVLKTVLSNTEVINKDVKQQLYYIKYQLEDGGFVSIATTRPETLFADVALAVHPEDKRHKHLVGKYVIHPLLNNRQPIIADPSVEIATGSGIMKISAHSAIDIPIILKHKLPVNECIGEDGKLNHQAMEFAVKERSGARKEIIKKLRREKKLDHVEEKVSAVGYSQRSNSIIEILVKPQWFVKMKPLSKLIFADFKSGGIKFLPRRFAT